MRKVAGCRKRARVALAHVALSHEIGSRLRGQRSVHPITEWGDLARDVQGSYGGVSTKKLQVLYKEPTLAQHCRRKFGCAAAEPKSPNRKMLRLATGIIARTCLSMPVGGEAERKDYSMSGVTITQAFIAPPSLSNRPRPRSLIALGECSSKAPPQTHKVLCTVVGGGYTSPFTCGRPRAIIDKL